MPSTLQLINQVGRTRMLLERNLISVRAYPKHLERCLALIDSLMEDAAAARLEAREARQEVRDVRNRNARLREEIFQLKKARS